MGGKWYDIPVFKIEVLELTFISWFVRMWSIVVAIFLVTLVGLFMVGIISFSYSKFKSLRTLLHLSCSRTLRLKSPVIWKGFKLFFVFLKNSFKYLWNGSITPFGGLYKKISKVFRSLWNKIFIESDSTSRLLILKSGLNLKFRDFFIEIETPPPLL